MYANSQSSDGKISGRGIMRTNIVHFNDKNENKILFWNFNPNASSNAAGREKMKKILIRALETELTDRQRKCITDYYLLGRREKDIACELGISPSTVSRHITNARKKLRHIASYYM